MKTLLGCLLALSGWLLMPQAEAATYTGESCVSRTPGAPLTYANGVRNNNNVVVAVACPLVRVKDTGTAPVHAVVYFSNDGVTKACLLVHFSPDTGSGGRTVSVTGVRRLETAAISPSLQFFPLTLHCSLPPGSSLFAYALGE